MSFVPHQNVFVDTTGIPTKVIDGRLPMRIPDPTDSRWGSRQAHTLTPKKHRKPGYDLVRMHLARMGCMHLAYSKYSIDAIMAHEALMCAARNIDYTWRAERTVSISEVGVAWLRPHVSYKNCFTGGGAGSDGFDALHPAVHAALKLTRPDRLRMLLMHNPRVSGVDPTQLIYTQTYDKMCREVYTRTSPGKYLRAMFSSLTDDEIRDIVAVSTAQGEFGITTELPKMIAVVQQGPQSCMRGDDFMSDVHPYHVYEPALGWGMAYRLSTPSERERIGARTYIARALVNIPAKIFVRSYETRSSGSYSEASEALETWLRGQGFSKERGWGECRLARIPHGDNNFVMPYIDGNGAVYGGNVDYFTTEETPQTPREMGEGDRTDGLLRDEDVMECADCDFRSSDGDDFVHVGRYQDHRVCRHCREDNYVYGYGQNGERYYFKSDYATYCDYNEEYYHENYYADNGIVECAFSGDIYQRGDTYECDHNGERYGDDVPHYRWPAYYVYHKSIHDAFLDNPDWCLDWYRNGCRSSGDVDYSRDEVLTRFCNNVASGEIELDEDDWDTYVAICTSIGYEPIANPFVDEDDLACINRDADPI